MDEDTIDLRDIARRAIDWTPVADRWDDFIIKALLVPEDLSDG